MTHASSEKIWSAAQEKLRSILSADIFNLWFAPLRVKELDATSITLDVQNDFCEVWLKENYLSLIQDMLAHVIGRKLQVKFVVSTNPVAEVSISTPIGKAKALEPPASRTTDDH